MTTPKDTEPNDSNFDKIFKSDETVAIPTDDAALEQHNARLQESEEPHAEKRSIAPIVIAIVAILSLLALTFGINRAVNDDSPKSPESGHTPATTNLTARDDSTSRSPTPTSPRVTTPSGEIRTAPAPAPAPSRIPTTPSQEDQRTRVSDENLSALEDAKLILDQAPVSKMDLFDELIERKHSKDAATYAVEYIEVDFKQKALEQARILLQEGNYSNDEVHNMLIRSKFTEEEASWAVDQL